MVLGLFVLSFSTTAHACKRNCKPSTTKVDTSKPSQKNVTGWISRDVWNSLTPALQKKFDAAIKKGIVAPTGQQGVIVLSKTEPLTKLGYTHKLKILGQGGDLRIYGKQQSNGHIIYDRIEGH